jgi:hypothetical protein
MNSCFNSKRETNSFNSYLNFINSNPIVSLRFKSRPNSFPKWSQASLIAYDLAIGKTIITALLLILPKSAALAPALVWIWAEPTPS